MNKLIAALLCIAVMFSAIPAVSFASGGGGVLEFFHADNLSGSLSFDYAHPSASSAVVSVTNLSQDTAFYSQTHHISDGKLSVKNISLTGEGSFRLSIKADNDVVSRDFTYLTSGYTEAFPEVTKAQVKAHVQNLTSASHPYLFASKARFEELCAQIKSGANAYLAESYHEIKETATIYLDTTPQAINPDGSSYISRGFEGWKIVMFCSFVYLMERGTDAELADAYAQRAYDEASYFCSLAHWGTNQYIDNNQLAFAVALCYDWLYEWLGDTQKTTLVNALKEKHLNTILDMFQNPTDPKYNETFYLWYFGGGNHTVLDNSSTVVQALAIADLDADYSAEIMATAMNNLHKPLARLAPDSVWLEGAGYWTFVGPFVARMIDALASSIGTSFGYADLPVIKNLGYFPIYQNSSQGSFVFCDAGDSPVTSPERFYFGKLNSDLGMESFALSTSPADPLLCIWYDPDADYTDASSFQKDMLYRNGDIVTMRSDWGSENELFAAMAVNKYTAESTAGLYQNSGTIAIDAIGEQWIKNPGRDNYDLPQYAVPHKADSDPRWSYYFSRAEANSCVVINPDKYGGQNLLFGDTISGFKASDSEAFAYASLAGAYRDDVSSYMRGIKMFDNRRKVLVKDEINLKESSEVYSFLSVYQSQIDLLPDGSGAILSKGDKKMLVKIKANAPFELSVTDAVQMDSSLRYEGDDTHPAERTWTVDYQRLTLRFDNAESLDISMIFAPFYGSETPDVSFENTSITNWTLNETAKLPLLSEVCLDGEKIKDFDAAQIYHTLVAHTFEPTFTASSDDGTVAIRKDSSGYVVTVTSDSGVVNTYHFKVLTLGTVTADTYVGGGSGIYKTNYGSAEYIALKGMNEYSQLLYYKLSLGDIPRGKRIKSISLELNACLYTDGKSTRPLSFYRTPYDSWHENSVICKTAPVNLAYATKGLANDVHGLPPKGYSEEDGYYSISPDASGVITFSHAMPISYPYGEGKLRKEVIDITDVYYAGNADSDFAFVITPGENSSNYVAQVASKEHPDASLRPRVLIELEDESGISSPKLISDSLYTQGYSYATAPRVTKPAPGDVLRAVTQVSESVQGFDGTMYVAQYDEDGTLLSVTSVPVTAINANHASNVITVLADAAQIKAFVWDSSDNPATTSETVSISQSYRYSE